MLSKTCTRPTEPALAALDVLGLVTLMIPLVAMSAWAQSSSAGPSTCGPDEVWEWIDDSSGTGMCTPIGYTAQSTASADRCHGELYDAPQTVSAPVPRTLTVDCAKHTTRISSSRLCSSSIEWTVSLEARQSCEADGLDLLVDFGDGSGRREAWDGQRVVANYGLGSYEVSAFLVPTEDGTSRRRAGLPVELSVEGRRVRKPTRFSWPAASFEGDLYVGEAVVFASRDDGLLYNPVIIVDGIDFDASRRWDCLYALMNRENALERALERGHDVVMLDFERGAGDIRGNSRVLQALIREINANKPGIAPVAVIGASMGGVVARHALLEMEANGESHGVVLYGSLDSPHEGANIPMALQLAVDWFAGEIDGADELWRFAINAPASRQLLLEHASTVDRFPRLDMDETDVRPQPRLVDAVPAPEFEELQQDLAALGGYPAIPRLVAFANGRGDGRGQGKHPGGLLLWADVADHHRRTILNLPGLIDVSANVRLHAAAHGQHPVRLMWLRAYGSGDIFNNSFAELLNIDLEYLQRGGHGLDTAPGGFRADLAELIADLPAEITQAGIVGLGGGGGFETFIPTRSALGIPGDEYYEDLGSAETPFDAVYVAETNEEHVCITPEKSQQFLEEVSLQNRHRVALLLSIL